MKEEVIQADRSTEGGKICSKQYMSRLRFFIFVQGGKPVYLVHHFIAFTLGWSLVVGICFTLLVFSSWSVGLYFRGYLERRDSNDCIIVSLSDYYYGGQYINIPLILYFCVLSAKCLGDRGAGTQKQPT